jgi:3-hydroxyacyl-[acyl-carrier-protein] dehydratase
MRFHLIDRILEVQPGRSLKAVKNLTLGEEYLADHFPGFPVMPGVLMLQTLVEAGAWLLRLSEDYQHSIIVLREVKNIKYGTFMEPGRQLTLTMETGREECGAGGVQGQGRVRGTVHGFGTADPGFLQPSR